MDLVRNPSFLALIVPLLMVYLLPKLTDSMMDPEEMKRAQEEMGTNDPQEMIRGFFGGGGSGGAGGDQKDDEDSD